MKSCVVEDKEHLILLTRSQQHNMKISFFLFYIPRYSHNYRCLIHLGTSGQNVQSQTFMEQKSWLNTVWCRYNVITFLQNLHVRTP